MGGSATVVPGVARVLREESSPRIVLFWRTWFHFFFLSWRYLVFQSVLINVVRALMPQRPEALTSYFGYRRGEYTPVGHFRAFVWIARDILVWMQMGVVLVSIVIRWLASRTAFVSNRTKVRGEGEKEGSKLAHADD